MTVYGGFAGYGAVNPNLRNPVKYKTILNGYIGEGDFGVELHNNTVVTMGDGALLDGVTVEEGGSIGGIDASAGTSTITNSIIKDNTQEGIYCLNGNLTASWCEIFNNRYQGIYH